MTLLSRTFAFGLLAVFACFAAMGQPKLVVSKPSSYVPGDQIDPETWVLDSGMNRVRLMELVKPETKTVVLVLFGGGFRTPPANPFRGQLWCQDSFDDLPVQRALVSEFAGAPVEFIAVAIAPVFSADDYGYPKNVFLGRGEGDREFTEAVNAFIEATEKEIATSLLPFTSVYYDPQARLTQNRDSAEFGSEYGEVFPWQGKLKWHLDPRKYGAPTIWLLNAAGEILSEPFWGNDYDSDPPEINYGFHELREAIAATLLR